MKSFYSIVYVNPKSVSKERISVGLLLVAEGLPKFKYSENKLNIIASYLGKETTTNIKNTLKTVKNYSDNIEAEKQLKIFDLDYFSSNYIEYINSYYNNLLYFTSPKHSSGDFYLRDYEDLFELFIDNIPPEKNLEKPKINFNKNFQNKLKRSKIRNYVDIDYTLPSELIPSIYDNHKVGFIGFNGSIISGNCLDFQREAYYVERDLYTLKALITGLDIFFKKVRKNNFGKHFLYINEPCEVKQENILNKAMKDETLNLDFRLLDEFETDEKWILEVEPTKFSGLINSMRYKGYDSLSFNF